MDPLIKALVAKIPPADQPWSPQDQRRWLELIAMAFRLVYGGTAEPPKVGEG